MDELWETFEYAVMDRPIKLMVRADHRWRAQIIINKTVIIDGVGLTPGMAVDRMAEQLLWYKDTHPDFIVARADV